MSDLVALAERVEAATGADRELDAEIWLAVTPGATRSKTIVPDHEYNGKPRCGWTIDETRENGHLIIVPAYTASLDAAMSLVLEGWRTAMVSEMEHRDAWHWRLGRKHSPQIRFGEGGVDGVAATPALALLSAALRARSPNPLPKDQ